MWYSIDQDKRLHRGREQKMARLDHESACPKRIGRERGIKMAVRVPQEMGNAAINILQDRGEEEVEKHL